MKETFVVKYLLSNDEVKTYELHSNDFEDCDDWSTSEIIDEIREDLDMSQDEFDDKFVKIINCNEMCEWLDDITCEE